jgi:hypothetical protein
MATVPPSAVVPLEERPLEERFTLPDMTPVQYREADSHDRIDVQLGAAARKDSELAPLAAFVKTDVQSRISLHGAVNADRAVSEHVWEFRAPGDAAVEISAFDAWAALYACECCERDRTVTLGRTLMLPAWRSLGAPRPPRAPARAAGRLARQPRPSLRLHHADRPRLPCARQQGHVRGAARPLKLLAGCVRCTLLLPSPLTPGAGAGAPRSRSWLQAHVPSVSDFGPLASTAFPHTISFTRSDDPPVLTTHPLRPPKPAPGAVLYSRWVHSVKQHLTLTHIDANNPEHFEAYCRWQNSDRVNVGWREKGDEAHHRKYHAGRLADPHIMGFLVAWDGELAGYGEASFNKEDVSGGESRVWCITDSYSRAWLRSPAAWATTTRVSVPSLSVTRPLLTHTPGTHLLIGESKFRGRHRFAAHVRPLPDAVDGSALTPVFTDGQHEALCLPARAADA